VQFETHHPTEPIEESSCSFVIWVALQAGIVDFRDGGVLLEKLGYLQCALVVVFHAEGEGLDSAVQQEGGVWIKGPSQMVQFVSHLLDQSRLSNDCSCHDVRVTVEVFGRTMEGQVEAQF
jgi:hypothetical protein